VTPAGDGSPHGDDRRDTDIRTLTPTAPVSRPADRPTLLAAARAGLRDHPGVLLYGPGGIGRSRLLAALTAEAEAGHARVLRCSPAESESRLPYAALIDLFAEVPDALIAKLPGPTRTALRAALLREEPAHPAGRLAVCLAVLRLLRILAADESPVWLALDDVQWLDTPTADVLRFAGRRLGDMPLRFIATERVCAGAPASPLHGLPGQTLMLEIPPMTPAEIAELIAERGGPVPYRTATEIHVLTGGNPRDALELRATLPPNTDGPRDPTAAEPEGGAGQAVDESPETWVSWLPARAACRSAGLSLPTSRQPRSLPRAGTSEITRATLSSVTLPERLRNLQLARVAVLPASAREILLLASAAVDPDLTLLTTAGGDEAAALLDVAEQAGVIDIRDDGRVSFDQPLLRRAIYEDASAGDRRRAHERLAGASSDPVARAKHLALARPWQDEALAAELMLVAESAIRRGAAEAASELAAFAAARTPAADIRQRAARLLGAADYACAAGRWDEARERARALLDGDFPADVRVSARVVLLRSAGQALEQAAWVIQDGLAEAASHPDLEARLRWWEAARHVLAGRVPQAEVEADRAARLAAAAGDTTVEVQALTTLAYVRSLTGDRRRDTTLARALSIAADGSVGLSHAAETSRLAAAFDLHADRFAAAESRLVASLKRFGETMSVDDRVSCLVTLTEVRVAAGDCAGALRAACQAMRCSSETGRDSGPALYAMASAESVGGSLEAACRYAERGIEASLADGDRLYQMRNLATAGRSHLYAGDAESAADALLAAFRIEHEIGVADPAVGRWHADLAEALILIGEHEQAEGVITRVSARATELHRASVTACLSRAAALRDVASGLRAESSAQLRDAATALGDLGLPLESARCWLLLADVEHRRRHYLVAKQALATAHQLCLDAGASALLPRIERELSRHRDREPGSPLTPSEQRVAELVCSGATNREIAAAIYLSVKTVEATLSRVYRKLGVRSRTELVRALAA
jgi:DNA-binding CsgD family transcriptional regulator